MLGERGLPRSVLGRNFGAVPYVPYQPDVVPPPSAFADTANRSRAGKWAIGVLLYLAAICAWIIWMKMPPPIEPPLASIPLGDGTELRLVHASFGNSLNLGPSATFDNRIRIPRRSGTSAVWSDAEPALCLALTRFDPRTERFEGVDLSSLRIVEPGSPYKLRALPLQTTGPGAPYRVVICPVFPRRLQKLTLEYGYRGARYSATMDNPAMIQFAGNSDATAPPGPQEKVSGNWKIRFEGIRFVRPDDATFHAGKAARPNIRVTHATAKAQDYRFTTEWRDLTGNRTATDNLPWSEPVWTLRVNVEETVSFPFPEAQVQSLGTIKVPAADQIIQLPLGTLTGRGLQEVLVLGKGVYSMNAGLLASKAGTGTGVRLRVTPSSVSGFNVQDWSVYSFWGRRNAGKNIDPILRVRKGDRICEPGTTGESGYNMFRQRHAGIFRLRGGGSIGPEDEVTIEAVWPKTHTFDFYIPRPDFPTDGAK